MTGKSLPRVLVFDVNETLLDLRALDPQFERIFGDAGVRGTWFGLVLRNALALTITGDYEDFVAVGGAALQMVADQHGVDLSAADRAAISDTMTSLPPHPDVAPALQRLFGAGLRLAALTNSPPDAAVSQLTAAGLAPLFEVMMSVDAVGKFKPAPEVYEMAAERLGVAPAEMMMVAAHDWDVAGAMRAGCAGAYVLRPGMVLNPLYPEPDVVGPDLGVIADRIVAAG
jgi:2-haloacid dehalogenase